MVESFIILTQVRDFKNYPQNPLIGLSPSEAFREGGEIDGVRTKKVVEVFVLLVENRQSIRGVEVVANSV